MNNIKKVIVTGSLGFLGRHLVERLKDDENYFVYALTSHPEDLKQQLHALNLVCLHKDIVDTEEAKQIISDAIVVNCAYPRNSTGVSIAEGLKYIQHVFRSGVTNGAVAIINVSSQSVYSAQRTQVATEETPICLESTYAVGKYAVELMLEGLCKNTKIAYTNIRLASLIGPGFDQRIVNRFVIKLMASESIKIVRQPKKMGYLDVEDAVSAILALIGSSYENWKPVYNVGNGKGYTVEEIYNVVASELRSRLDIIEPAFEIGTDESTTAVSFHQLNADTGFVPVIDLDESVRKIIAHM